MSNDNFDGANRYLELVDKWLSHNRAEFSMTTNAFIFGSEENSKSVKDIASDIMLDVESKHVKYSAKNMETAVSRVASFKRDAELKRLQNTLGMYSGNDAAVREFITRLLDANLTEDERENAICVMKQWIWLVKRSLFGLKETYHIMPIFWSNQGSGKSTVLKRLLEPLKGGWRTDNFSIFIDQFSALRMHYSYVLFLDEMDRVEKSGSAALKEAISNDHIGGRQMFSDEVRQRIRRASFIAATNDAPPHGLTDTNGARRFFSMRVRNQKLEGEYAKWQREFDPYDVWACVDVNAGAPFIQRKDLIEIEQNRTVRATSLLEDFITERTSPMADSRIPMVHVQEAFGAYLEFRKENRRERPGSLRELSARLKTLGFDCVDHGNKFYLKDRILDLKEV